ncbi:tyrosine-type recombinase/integrase [Streptomyces mirabilis]|uniref:tyrosine-type recombinase/integrase n=1 Tax=Streptomyces mirabilis TaxID=68239 RepID=UPI0036A55034
MPEDGAQRGVRDSLLDGWGDLTQRQEAVDVRPGDPIFLAPDYRVDELLSLYVQSARFRRHTPETKRNYATDISLFLNFLWGRGYVWTQAMERDLEDFEHWRRFAPSNPRIIGGSKWNRELAALTGLYAWAVKSGHMPHSPVMMKDVFSRSRGTVLTVPATKAKDARGSNVHWLTPRAFRRWAEVGLRGHTREGLPAAGWCGRLEDRNVAFADLLYSSGMRRGEGGSLLTFEVPQRRLGGGRYYVGRIAAAVTRSKKPRTFYVGSDVVGEIETYVDSSRALTVRKAQQAGRYDNLPAMQIVTHVTGGVKPTVHWQDRHGNPVERRLADLTVGQRLTLYSEGRYGPEPLWLWLNERGLPFHVDSWEGVFRTANERCKLVLTPPECFQRDPHRVYAPYATPHSCRHSFALYMLVVLNHLMDQRFGLTPEERRDFRLLYGDPWHMVQNLLGHASRETTCEIYLAPVADLQLRALLAAAPDAGQPMQTSLDSVFARLAQESEGIQDVDDRMLPVRGATE